MPASCSARPLKELSERKQCNTHRQDSFPKRCLKGLFRNKTVYLPEMILERDKERRSLHSLCTMQTMSDAVAAQKHLAFQGVPSFGYCDVAPHLCAAVGTEISSRLALTLNPGLQIDSFVTEQPLRRRRAGVFVLRSTKRAPTSPV